MHRMAVGHLQAMHYQMLDGVVRGQIPEIDQRGSLHIRNAALPQSPDAATIDYLAERMCCTMYTRRLAHEATFALHLYLHLNQISGRCKPLRHGTRSDAAQSRLPDGQRLGAVLGELLAHQVIAADPHTAVDEEEEED